MKSARLASSLALAVLAAGLPLSAALAEGPPAPAPVPPEVARAPDAGTLVLEAAPPPAPVPPAPTAAQSAAAARVAEAAKADAARADGAPPPASAERTRRDARSDASAQREAQGEQAGPPAPARTRSRRRAAAAAPPPGDARQGLILGIGFGGASQFTSIPGYGRAAATDLALRIGYGFSDRFQFFVDADWAHARYAGMTDTTNWMLTLRGQTVLIGDRRGNGLSLNAGIGLGDFGQGWGRMGRAGWGDPGWDTGSPLGFVVAGGLAYDARIGRFLAISPELFASWHALPNAGGDPNDIVTELGLRLNLTWTFR